MVDAALLTKAVLAGRQGWPLAMGALDLIFVDHPTWRESDLRKRCEEIALAPAAATADDIEALLAGWQRFVQYGRIDEIVRMAERFPPGLVEREPVLGAYL